METFAANIDTWLAMATIAAQIVTLILLAVFLLRKRNETARGISESVAQWGLWIVFVASFFGSLMTLVYSEVLGFEPCPLCWWQRIFLYPQIVLAGMAAWKRDVYIADYSIVLSIFGLGVALYHHALQMFPNSLPCPATGVSCAQRVIFEFGYVTFPMMAATMFAFLIVVTLFVRARAVAAN